MLPCFLYEIHAYEGSIFFCSLFIVFSFPFRTVVLHHDYFYVDDVIKSIKRREISSTKGIITIWESSWKTGIWFLPYSLPYHLALFSVSKVLFWFLVSSKWDLASANHFHASFILNMSVVQIYKCLRIIEACIFSLFQRLRKKTKH